MKFLQIDFFTMAAEKLKCGYCNFLLGDNIESAVRHFPIHSCLAAFEHVVIEEETGAAYGYTPSDSDNVNELNVTSNSNHYTEVFDCDRQENVIEKWTHEEILLLIEAYEEHSDKFGSPQYNKKQVWDRISRHLREHCVIKSGAKCDEKWRNLKKQYEKILKLNSQTGSDRRTWIYFQRLHDIFFTNPSVNPLATISSGTGCLKMRQNTEAKEQPVTQTRAAGNSGLHVAENINLKEIEECQKNKKIRKETKEQAKERRHREKIEQRERIFNWAKENSCHPS